ncbi:zinc ribbon domain-containing protein [Ruminococcus bromii]|uniref:Putative membrane protein n=1 Tax=Ruminococcus bromii TaxID=40518 RepID=A0A2N0UZD9_9FIRM|nr:hypothetical protein [Ruminococcus bromii]PKD32352.1 putative membrane protein [Ruminococcus bromii]
MRRCPKCGFPLNEKDKYCENCGEDCSAVEDSEVNEVVSPDEEKEKLKRQWKIGGIVFGVVALVFAAILALVLFVPHSSSSSNTNTKTKSSLTEPTTVDNSIDGKGYYYFDNKFNEETVDKFMSAFDDVGSMGDLGIGVEFDDFKYQQDYLLLGKKVSQYMQVDFNGKTGTILFLDDENNVVAYSLTFVSSLLNDITTDDVYKKKQTVGRLASWLYALSDYKSYNSCEKVAKYFISEMLDEDNKLIPCLYYNGYTMLCNGNANQIALNFFVTDSDFIERHGIDKGTSSIFQAVTESTTTEPTTDVTTTEESSDAKPDKVNDSEIEKAEELLKEEPYGIDDHSDTYLEENGVDVDEYHNRLNVYDAIHYYLSDVTLDAQRNEDGSITMKYTGMHTVFGEGEYITYIVNIENKTVYYDSASYDWLLDQDFYATDVYNDLVSY